jgi:hypothetical protein
MTFASRIVIPHGLEPLIATFVSHFGILHESVPLQVTFVLHVEAPLAPYLLHTLVNQSMKIYIHVLLKGFSCINQPKGNVFTRKGSPLGPKGSF